MTETGENSDNFGIGLHSVPTQNSYGSDLEITALKQMAYDSNFAEDINMKMRIPQKLTVISQHDEEETEYTNAYATGQQGQNDGNAAYKMEVPDRIIVSVGDNGVKYRESYEPRNAEEFTQDSTSEILSLTTPPRKLTLAERNLDALDICETQNDSNGSESSSDLKTHDSLSSVLMERIVPEVQQNESKEELDDVSSLRRQIFKLHRRITAIEKQQAEKSKRDTFFYAATVAFWIINGWFLYNLRKPY